MPQRGISGCYQSGADAIIVSGKRFGCDDFENLKYVAEWRIGANSLVISFLRQSPIRVFRSAEYIHINNMAGRATFCTNNTSNFYRYDGLYRIAYINAPVGKSPILCYLNWKALDCHLLIVSNFINHVHKKIQKGHSSFSWNVSLTPLSREYHLKKLLENCYGSPANESTH